MNNLTSTSDWLADKIASIQDEQGNAKFQLLGDNLGGKGLPLVAWRLKNKEAYDGRDLYRLVETSYLTGSRVEFAIARTLRSRGWIGELSLY